MTKSTLKQAREKIAKLNFARSYLYMAGCITEAENEKIHSRMLKLKEKFAVEITEEQLNSVKMTYKD